MARINSFLSQFVADEFSLNPPVWLNELRCLAGFTITTWHDIHAAMRTLPMTMNPNNIFRPPARWALRLQNRPWLGVSGVWRLIFYRGLFYLGQIGHPALDWCKRRKHRSFRKMSIDARPNPAKQYPPCQSQDK